MKLLTRVISISLLSLSLAACAPRGETKSVQEVLTGARETYASAAQQIQNGALKDSLRQITDALEKMTQADVDSETLSENSARAGDILANLIKTAGYTSRPSMGEIITQHRVLSSEAKKEEINPARVKLLAARTYGMLTSELETTKFTIEPLLKRAA